ncbi:coenzyme F420-0:L-glutamate ligase [Candidatus Peregrinibacteria bacterium]|nr:coenzyme F420-0:L-glutamate ligase [Candidatus Peregrinibacteria bacterium]
MELLPLKSRLLKPGGDLLTAFRKAIGKGKLKEGDVIVVASKAVAYSQGRLMSVESKKKFRELIKKEADAVLEDGEMVITLKNQILIPNAGIDNSNTPKGTVVLWPERPFEAARDLLKKLKKIEKIKKLGMIISDSHCQPLRMGTSGIAIGWAGFYGVQDERGKKDLFGKKMVYTQIAVADDLASAANLLMGETDASVPFVIARGLDVKWSDKAFSEKDYFIHPKKCIYKHFYSSDFKNLKT